MDNNEIDIEMEAKEISVWKEVLKGAQNELANTKEIHFKNTLFNEAIIKLAEAEIKKYEAGL